MSEGSEKEGPSEDAQGLGGARADFVASLGRKVSDARKSLTALESDPRAQGARDELRRKLHALGTSARMMRFEAMAQALAEAEAALESIDPSNAATLRNVSTVARSLDDLPALAWNDARRPAPVRESAAGSAPTPGDSADPAAGGQTPMTVLVVGPESIAETLLETEDHRAIECERTEDAQHAIGLARAIAPDVMVLDAELPQAAELVEALADDPLTEPVPIVVVGKLTPSTIARFVALGVARTLTAPYSGDVLRNACDEALDQRDGRTMRLALGDPTVEQLADRLADEVRRALVGSVDTASRDKRVQLGEGTEVMAAIWGAISRVREVVTSRTGGAVRFAGGGPEGSSALTFQPDMPGSDRVRRGRGAAADVTLEGRRILVADDDPGVTWFLSDLLRTTGCVVHEALDGATAFEIAMRTSPDVVISDILMPKMDGFALSRAIKRDVALRDTPVILLSWKEDLLQRVRELGASAAAYLRKESDARSVLARVREVLWPRARVEARLKGTGEVRGRLDGVTVRSLLEFVATLRQDARISIRDASCLYEVEMREGAPRRATRTAGDGNFARGPKVLRELLGVSAGRFIVAPPTHGALIGELTGTLAHQLEKHIAGARGAMAVTSGAHATRAARLQLDDDVLSHYLRATPEPARSLIVRMANGTSPRTLLLEGQVVPSLLDDVLTDLAARGAIVGVNDEEGRDILEPAVAAALAILQGAPTRNATPLSPMRPSMTPPPIVAKARDASQESSVNVSIDQILQQEEAKAAPPPPKPELQRAPKVSRAASVETSLQVSVQQLLDEEARVLAEERRSGQPSSLEDAVIQKLGETSEVPGVHRSSPLPPPIIEPSALRPRSSNPPAEAAPVLEPALLAITQDHTEVETVYELATPTIPHLDPALTEERIEKMAPAKATTPTPAPAVKTETTPSTPTKPEGVPRTIPPTKTPLSSVARASHPPQSRSNTPVRWLAVLGIIALAIGVAVRLSLAPPVVEPVPTTTQQGVEAPINVLYTEVPAGATIGDNEGWLEIHAPEGAHVLVDGIERPAGPIAAGAHEIRVGVRTHSVEIRSAKTARVDWP